MDTLNTLSTYSSDYARDELDRIPFVADLDQLEEAYKDDPFFQ